MGADELRWYRINEQEYAVAATQHALRCLKEVSRDWQQLPWAIIALHNATQAAMIAHLTGTAGIGALSKQAAEEMLSALQGEREYPASVHVAKFNELVIRIRRENRRIEQAGSVVSLSNSEVRELRRLNSLRNEFVHFSPKGWSLEISGLPKIVAACVTILRAVHQCGWSLLHLESEEVEVYLSTINALAEEVGAMFIAVD